MGKDNTRIKDLLIADFNICFLNGQICKENPYTFHHIQAKRDGGKATYENGALLRVLQHTMFNVIENDNQKRADEINDYFQYFKETKDMEALIQMGIYVNKLINQLDYEVDNKGKLLTLRRKAIYDRPRHHKRNR